MIARPPPAVPLLALAAFLALLGLVVAGWAPLHGFDTAVSEAFRAYGNGHAGLVSVLRVVTDVAATVPFLLAGLGVSVLFAARRDRRRAGFCATVTVVVPVLWTLMHLLLYSPRPQGFVVATSNGFPSGHTANAMAAALAAVLLLWPQATRTVRVAAVVLGAAFAIFIGLTRVALLAHWPADVFGGWLLAFAAVPLAARLAERIPTAVAGP